jgi:hypothetical protein
MLESYLREIQSIEGALRETEENLENARQGWQIALDASRNHIIQANLTLSFISISVMAATLLPAAMGMNLDSGLSPNDPAAFWGVCGLSAAVALLSFPLGRALYLRHWRKVAQQELFEQKMLRLSRSARMFTGGAQILFFCGCGGRTAGGADRMWWPPWRLSRFSFPSQHNARPPPPKKNILHAHQTTTHSVLLMQHADELDDVVAALGQAHRAGHPIDKLRFRRILADALGTRALSAGKADFLWHLFDTDRSGFLSEAEVLRRVTLAEEGGGGRVNSLPPEAGGLVVEGSGGGGDDGGWGGGGAEERRPTVRRPPPRGGS